MERQEYTAETYPSFGKKYNGEKAIISLTSWRARINTVSKTIYSLIKQCPGFHIVLVLSEEEFPKKMKELPENLMLFVENKIIEVLWVYRNYKSFKKVLFTMNKYRHVPIISADDDCIYTGNYAQELYDAWIKNKNCVIRYPTVTKQHHYVAGPYTIYPIWNVFGKKAFTILNTTRVNINYCFDDDFYNIVIKLNKIQHSSLNKKELPCFFIAQHCAIHKDLI